ncbi:heparinase II/III family protein [Candidatus Peregrinibacteria bacterium]|nr:heparinase II/III family protein [Candidatus Peregrinibacteria bacterium]
MFEFARHYTKPNGRAPQIGDGDDGRLFIFEDFYGWDPRDHRHLFLLGRELFPLNKKFDQNSPAGRFEAASRAFPQAGIFILRSKNLYAIVDAGQNGQNGNGGHAHNDTLSFEL